MCYTVKVKKVGVMENGIVKERKNTGLVVVIVVLAVMVIGLGGFVVFDKVLRGDVVEGLSTTTVTTGKAETTTAATSEKTVLVCESEKVKEKIYTRSYTANIEFVNDIFTNYEFVETLKYDNATNYRDAKHAYITYNELYHVEYDDGDFVIKVVGGTAYGTLEGNSYIGENLAQVKVAREKEFGGKTICTMQR